jgi:Mg/Co/Ni transporter MgtE
MALGEVKLRMWFRLMRRELLVGLALGTVLAALGLIRILACRRSPSSCVAKLVLSGTPLLPSH